MRLGAQNEHTRGRDVLDDELGGAGRTVRDGVAGHELPHQGRVEPLRAHAVEDGVAHRRRKEGNEGTTSKHGGIQRRAGTSSDHTADC
ncbi:hypothetical protein GCM10009740_32620 [Terrabacter terrae]|uniref:Uncharacterized protein n=1 Tax=Terrabacter terrae TaxID=318434 RepID=A0ABP5G373_9MICO